MIIHDFMQGSCDYWSVAQSSVSARSSDVAQCEHLRITLYLERPTYLWLGCSLCEPRKDPLAPDPRAR